MKKFILKSVLLTSLSIASSIVIAQDIHFSQMRYSPLNLNPGLTGADGNLQISSNYRTQWNSVAAPFETIGASFETRIREKRGANGFLALGLNFFNDVAGDVRMRTTNASLNVAYHAYLDDNSTLGLGMQAGFGQRGISPDNGLWESQFVGTGFNPLISSGENFAETSFSHFDAGAGMVYKFKDGASTMRSNDQREFTAGLAAYHVNRPENNFLVGGEDALAVRWTAFAHGLVGIRNTNWSYMPAAYYVRQRTHQEFLLGSYIRVLLKEASRSTVFFNAVYMSYGAFYRVGDAMVAKFMLEYSHFSLGFAYDFNVSTLTPVSNGRGGLEVFLRYSVPRPVGPNSRSRIR